MDDKTWRLDPLDLNMPLLCKSGSFEVSATLSTVPFTSQVTDKMKVILKQIRRQDTRGLFFGAIRQDTEYTNCIRHPMNLSVTLQRIDNEGYSNIGEILSDIDLVWANCYLFHGKATLNLGCSSRYAQQLQWMLDSYMRELEQELRNKGWICSD